jgi:diaminopimelate epimerase
VFPQGGNRVRLHYSNRDGSAAAFCANATRCAARVASERLGLGPRLEVVTGWGPIAAEVNGASVTLDLPAPVGPARRLSLEAAGLSWRGWRLELGTPHLVLEVRDPDALDLERVAPPLRSHPELGAEGANVSFIHTREDGIMTIRTWERGVEGETLACGSGIVAAALLTLKGSARSRLECRPRSGDLLVVEACGSPPLCRSRLTGPARIVADLEPTAELLEG